MFYCVAHTPRTLIIHAERLYSGCRQSVQHTPAHWLLDSTPYCYFILHYGSTFNLKVSRPDTEHSTLNRTELWNNTSKPIDWIGLKSKILLLSLELTNYFFCILYVEGVSHVYRIIQVPNWKLGLHYTVQGVHSY